jgi:hypothetical protein
MQCPLLQPRSRDALYQLYQRGDQDSGDCGHESDKESPFRTVQSALFHAAIFDANIDASTVASSTVA